MLSLQRLNPVDQRSYIAKRKEDARVPTILFCEIKVRVIETNLSLKIKHLYLLANKEVIAVEPVSDFGHPSIYQCSHAFKFARQDSAFAGPLATSPTQRR